MTFGDTTLTLGSVSIPHRKTGPMRAKPLISLTAATGLIDAIARGGGHPDLTLRTVGLDRSVISQQEGFIPCAVFAQLLEAAAEDTQDPCFGLHFGESYEPKNIGPLVYVVLNSPTFGAAFDNIGRYLHLHNEAARVSRTVEGSWAYLRHELVGLAVEHPRQHAEYSMVVSLNTLQLMAGSQWAPVEAQFAHKAPNDWSEQTRVFGCPVSFDCPTNALVVAREFLDRQVPAADERLYPIVRRYLDGVLQDGPKEEGVLAAARRAIVEIMRDGDPTLSGVAKQMGLSPRTLQRRIDDLGMTFKRLVGETRHRSSLNYLRDPKHTLTEIAYLLGYSEVSAFNRAFRRWTGSTPSAYRQSAHRRD